MVTYDLRSVLANLETALAKAEIAIRIGDGDDGLTLEQMHKAILQCVDELAAKNTALMNYVCDLRATNVELTRQVTKLEDQFTAAKARAGRMVSKKRITFYHDELGNPAGADIVEGLADDVHRRGGAR